MTDIKCHSSAMNKCPYIMKFIFRSFVRCCQSFSQNLLDVIPTACVRRVYLLLMKVKDKGEIQLLTPGKIPGTRCTGGCIGLRAGLDRCRKITPIRTQSLDHQACSELLYLLRCPYVFHIESDFKEQYY